MTMKRKRKLSYSQNFLKSPEFVTGLLDKTDIGPVDLVVEIGPGKGIITKQLLDRVRKVIAIEKDSGLAKDLQALYAEKDVVEIVNADFLEWKLPLTPYKVFSNIPFNMTADIIGKLLESKQSPEIAYLILQDKAAERFIGKPVGRDTQMSILLKVGFEMEIVTHIDRGQFIPRPQINAVLAKFKKRQNPLVEKGHEQLFRDFVVYGYNQWKSSILEAFEKIFSSKQQAILSKKLSIRKAKPRDLGIDDWLALFNAFLKHVPSNKQVLVRGAEAKLKIQQEKLQKQHRTRQG